MSRGNQKAIDKMDAKKGRSNTKKMEAKKVVNFVGDVKQELKRVEWTSKDELRSYTKIVLLSIFFFGLFIYFVDLFLQGVLGAINTILKFIVG